MRSYVTQAMLELEVMAEIESCPADEREVVATFYAWEAAQVEAEIEADGVFWEC